MAPKRFGIPNLTKIKKIHLKKSHLTIKKNNLTKSVLLNRLETVLILITFVIQTKPC